VARLDLGCGTSQLYEYVLQHGLERRILYSGLDLSPACSLARARSSRITPPPEVDIPLHIGRPNLGSRRERAVYLDHNHSPYIPDNRDHADDSACVGRCVG
jgi:hypothetical protein